MEEPLRLEVRARHEGRRHLLIETCQLVGVNPRDYLREAVHRAKANPDDAYLPHAMLDDASDLNRARDGDTVGTVDR